MVKPLPGNEIHQQTFQVSAHVALEKRIHRSTQFGTVLVVVARVKMATDEQGPIEKKQRFNLYPRLL